MMSASNRWWRSRDPRWNCALCGGPCDPQDHGLNWVERPVGETYGLFAAVDGEDFAYLVAVPVCRACEAPWTR